jgi:hypothetical protein
MSVRRAITDGTFVCSVGWGPEGKATAERLVRVLAKPAQPKR